MRPSWRSAGAIGWTNHATLEHLARTRSAILRVRINFVETADNHHARAEVEQLARQPGLEFFYRREHTRGRVTDIGRPMEADEGCGIFAAVTFIRPTGPCCLASTMSEAWQRTRTGVARVLAWKRQVIGDSRGFPLAPAG